MWPIERGANITFLLTGLVTSALLSVALTAGPNLSAFGAARVGAPSVTGLPTSLPVRAEHRYRMLGKVRPLLFWISRDDVGGARITWRGAKDSTGYELLIGSDPARAPRRINRWGYIAEEVLGSEARVLGVMKQSKEESLAEAETQIARESQQPGYVFKAIKGLTSGLDSRAGVLTVRVDRDLTYRDLDPLMTLVASAGQESRIRQVAMPAGARPGFLTALADLIHQTVQAHRQQSNAVLPTRSVPYVYNGTLSDLTVRRSSALHNLELGRHRYRDVIRSNFDSKDRRNGQVTHFQITYGTTGALAEIPVHVVYRPRWWLEVQLFLDDATDF